MLFFKREGKWDEIPYVELFFYLRDKPKWQRACGIMVVKITVDEQCKACTGEKHCIGHQALENGMYYRRDNGNTDLEEAPPALLERGQTVRGESEDSEGKEGEEKGAVALATLVSYRT